MDNKKFNLWNHICAAISFVVSAVTYLMTIEPTASFWDCGEFIASSYKLEVGHAPGNPVFQLFARFFTMFTGAEHAAVAVNALSAICSALTIFFLYLTIVFLAKRLVHRSADGTFSTGRAISIFGAGLVGSLAYCFSDTFWFSAVEGEVYAMSSLFTALVFWAMTKWYEQADSRYANRWIVLISFLMGLSVGIHLLNLLTIPCLVFMFYHKKRENGSYTFWQNVGIFAVSCVILAVILFVIIPYLPKTAAWFDLFFVNTLGLPFNSGAAFFMVALLALCFWGLFRTLRKNQAFANTILLCFTMIVIGFSIFSICIIRSSAKTPTNENQPDNAFGLVRYLSREQYGKNPLIYGQYFDAPGDIVYGSYWTPLNGKYYKAPTPPEMKYDASGMMFFPRMWCNADDKYIRFYESYMNGGGKKVKGAEHKMPTFGQNLAFFFDYQLNWMYWRYFMWNFVGRQNDLHSPSPGEIFEGNWESGIGIIDRIHLGDQSNAPDYLRENGGKNHYFFLPFLLGVLGIFFQFGRDKRGSWLTFLLFFMTGIAIVLYLNQPPFQVRERDYAYAGSFYAFCIWIGLAVTALYTAFEEIIEGWGRADDRSKAAVAAATTVLCLGVPALMAAQNWDDHDRSNRYTAVEIAKNYLNSVGPNGILVTHGDNDTFPLWYAQEVEGIRTDVRVVNTSLLGTDWHIDQMKWAVNESAPLALSIGPEQYLYGTNDWPYIYDTRNTVIPIEDVMKVFRHPDAKLTLQSGKNVDYIISHKISVPVNKENVIKYGILDAKYADQIPDEIILTMSEDKDYISKQELFMLDLLSNYQWDRPINLLSMGGDLNMGIKEYLMFDGFSYRFVPIRNKTKLSTPDFVDVEDLYHKMTQVYTFDAVSRDDYFIDYQNFYTYCGVMSLRQLFVSVAKQFVKAGHEDWALEMIDKAMEVQKPERFPLNMTEYGFSNELMIMEIVNLYYICGQPEKARDLARAFAAETCRNAQFYFDFYEYAKPDFESNCQYIYYVSDILRDNGDEQLADEIESSLKDTLGI
ncbi:MAG: DUF2723 domain-containing protein [Bacteroidales bacterium]|nr:DUF2723 domain-containing protein [Bacteroidales bacterium]